MNNTDMDFYFAGKQCCLGLVVASARQSFQPRILLGPLHSFRPHKKKFGFNKNSL
jgi:hypothetical protein